MYLKFPYRCWKLRYAYILRTLAFLSQLQTGRVGEGDIPMSDLIRDSFTQFYEDIWNSYRLLNENRARIEEILRTLRSSPLAAL